MRGGPHSSACVTPQRPLWGRGGVWEGVRARGGCAYVSGAVPGAVQVRAGPEPACERACAGRAARVCACVCLLRAPSLPVPPGAGGALGAWGSQAELWDPGPGGSQIRLWGYPRAPGLGWWVSVGRTRCQQGGLLQKCGFLPPQNDFGFLTKWKFSPKSPHWEKLRVSSRREKLVDVLPVAKHCVLLVVPPPQ